MKCDDNSKIEEENSRIIRNILGENLYRKSEKVFKRLGYKSPGEFLLIYNKERELSLINPIINHPNTFESRLTVFRVGNQSKFNFMGVSFYKFLKIPMANEIINIIIPKLIDGITHLEFSDENQTIEYLELRLERLIILDEYCKATNTNKNYTSQINIAQAILRGRKNIYRKQHEINKNNTPIFLFNLISEQDLFNQFSILLFENKVFESLEKFKKVFNGFEGEKVVWLYSKPSLIFMIELLKLKRKIDFDHRSKNISICFWDSKNKQDYNSKDINTTADRKKLSDFNNQKLEKIVDTTKDIQILKIFEIYKTVYIHKN